MVDSKKQEIIFWLSIILLIFLIGFMLYVYNQESTMCMTDPLKYAEKKIKYCSCFCLEPIRER